MSFTAKVRATGQLFLAGGQTDNAGILRDAHTPMRPGLKYSGNLLDAYPGNSPWVEFNSGEWAVFDADDLEDFPVELRLVKF